MLTCLLPLMVAVTMATADRVTYCPDFCRNGGSCVIPDKGAKYCLCPSGWVGVQCDKHVGTACDSFPCQNGYTCSPVGTGDYSCGCDVSFGKNCHLAKPMFSTVYSCEESEAHRCDAKDTCVLEQVVCKRAPCPGYATCVPKSPDVCSRHKPCHHGGTCMVTSEGDYVCKCNLFYGGRQCDIPIV